MPMDADTYEFDPTEAKEIYEKGFEVSHAKPLPPIEKHELTDVYELMVTALFVDIVDSTPWLRSADERYMKFLQILVSEVQNLFFGCPNVLETGVRGDCLYCIVESERVKPFGLLVQKALLIFLVVDDLNKRIQQVGLPKLRIGVGVGVGPVKVMRVGRNDGSDWARVWCGGAVIDACHLANEAGRGEVLQQILMSKEVYDYLPAELKNEFNQISVKKVMGPVYGYTNSKD